MKLTGERINAFPLGLRLKQKFLFSPLLVNIILKFLPSVKTKKRNKGHANWKGQNKIILQVI